LRRRLRLQPRRQSRKQLPSLHPLRKQLRLQPRHQSPRHLSLRKRRPHLHRKPPRHRRRSLPSRLSSPKRRLSREPRRKPPKELRATPRKRRPRKPTTALLRTLQRPKLHDGQHVPATLRRRELPKPKGAPRVPPPRPLPEANRRETRRAPRFGKTRRSSCCSRWCSLRRATSTGRVVTADQAGIAEGSRRIAPVNVARK